MRPNDFLFDYLAVLAVIQPARIQDIEMYAPKILPDERIESLLETEIFRAIHQKAREAGLVIPVKRGTYFLSQDGREMVRRSDLYKEIDNLRLFLMKDQRRRYK